MLHRGIPGHPTAHAQALAFEELGAAFGAMTYVDHGVLSCSVPTENLERALELTARLCEAPLFSDIAIEKGIVREELLESYDGNGRLIDGASILRELCFGRHPLGMPIAGTKTTLARFDARGAAQVPPPPLRRRGHGASRWRGRSSRRAWAGSRRGVSAALPRGARRDGGGTAAAARGAVSLRVRHRQPDLAGLGFRAPGERDPDEPATELLMRVLDDGNATRLVPRALRRARALLRRFGDVRGVLGRGRARDRRRVRARFGAARAGGDAERAFGPDDTARAATNSSAPRRGCAGRCWSSTTCRASSPDSWGRACLAARRSSPRRASSS